MKPAFSAIIFTCLSGAGYGLLLFLPVGILGDAPGLYRGSEFSSAHIAAWVVGFGLVTAGLLSSLFHLGHPERFLRALTQWRTSWLSREGVLAIVSFVPLGLAAFVEIYYGVHVPMLAVICIFVVFLTVYSTSMIYGSIKATPYWNNRLTPAVYLSFGASSGWMLIVLFKAVLGQETLGDIILASILIVLGFGIMITWWISNDRAKPVATIEDATGLGEMGKVTQLERPHMNENYLLSEMGFVIGRKHGDRLRKLSVLIGALLPIGLIVVAFFFKDARLAVIALVLVAALSHLIGVFISRWLFFAQAKHTVMLYYGQEQV